MLKAVLVSLIVCLTVDNFAFDGYYQFMATAEAKDLYQHFMALGWQGLFFR
ncbi:hypothetical protein [Allosphingosinicella vermicomposti]|uniref:hypothetical protein n=1 Tax=Allosphingosinicella vermicomposti TaxID=614671 RepID=UPI00131A507E|nr:hypothetical protein [Allosphingosinicella vermicomposti]